MDLHQLKRSSLEELEALYVHEDPIGIPRGCFRGHHLVRLDNPGARRLWVQATQVLGFQLVPFGVDFDARSWYFFSPMLQIGAFVPQKTASCWRDTNVIALHYHVSRLPGVVRNALYDEVKPLSDRLCLGMGGLEGGPGLGDHFFFALERIR